jgi:pantoate--beta-alanine ligase
MKTFKSARELKAALDRARSSGKSVGFVPTMGGLHEGHLSLVRRSVRENVVTVASVFVNPLQFGPKEDYKRYPRNLDRDKRLLESVGADCLFAPDEKTFYPENFETLVGVGPLARTLCGASRPGHFAGVVTVVLKLLNAVSPDRIYLGQKDYQQCLVVERMMLDLDVPAQLRICPIVREKDGLAMSSRNVFLSEDERRQAVVIYRALSAARESAERGEKDTARLKRFLRGAINAAPSSRIDYVEIVDAATLSNVLRLKKGKTTLFAAAIRFGKTRLIDNLLYTD